MKCTRNPTRDMPYMYKTEPKHYKNYIFSKYQKTKQFFLKNPLLDTIYTFLQTYLENSHSTLYTSTFRHYTKQNSTNPR